MLEARNLNKKTVIIIFYFAYAQSNKAIITFSLKCRYKCERLAITVLLLSR